MTKNSFKLPDELGWECNDEISKKLDEVVSSALEHMKNADGNFRALWEVTKAEVMDEVYAIIVKYQDNKRNQ